MSAGATAALGVGCLLVGGWIGAATQGGVPDTRVVTVEKPVVHTETVHDTEYETRPLPDSCETVVDTMNALTEASADVGRAGDDILLKAEQITPTLMKDPTKVAELYAYFVEKSKALDSALSTQLQMNTDVALRLETCEADIEASNNGDDVAPLDGESGVTP